MAGRRSTTVVEPYWGWLTVPAEWMPRDNRLSVDEWDAIAHPAARPRPKLAI
ncbi:hypothetical protein [Nocardia sp. CA-135398]|uniref:hypothetical protein n=1 Tax=Nocardia sp. CA-135398 TaxID=3239977 RepID=UPI003D97FD56